MLEFAAGERPDAVVDAYWSVILVDLPDYRVAPNTLNRFNFNNYSGLKTGADGSLTILISAKPHASVPESNWLPAPAGRPFSLTLRTYVPKDARQARRMVPAGAEACAMTTAEEAENPMTWRPPPESRWRAQGTH